MKKICSGPLAVSEYHGLLSLCKYSPEDGMLTNSLWLTESEAAELWPILKEFVETGEVKEG